MAAALVLYLSLSFAPADVGRRCVVVVTVVFCPVS